MGLFGIIVALVLFLFLVYKGWRNYYVAPIMMIIVCIFNQLKPVEAFVGSFIPGMLEMCSSVFVVIFMATLFGKIYAETGGSISVAKFLSDKFILPAEGNKKVLAALLSYFVVGGLCIIGGIDAYCSFFSLIPIAIILAKQANIPRRFVPGMLFLNAAFFACPGAPQIYNIMSQAAFGSVGMHYDVNSALVPGLVAVAIIAVGSLTFLYKMITKYMKNNPEVGFEYGNVPAYVFDDTRRLPHPLLAILPLVIVFVLYSILKLDISIALTVGILFDLVTMGRFIQKEKYGGGLKNSIKLIANDGVDAFPDALLSIATPAGLAAVITSTAAFGGIVHMLSTLEFNPIILTVVVVCIIVAITSSPPTAIMIAIPMVVGILAAKGIEVNVGGMGRVASLAASTFETLPINGSILLALKLADCKHKDSYFPMFMESVVFCLIGTVVCGLLIIACPGLA